MHQRIKSCCSDIAIFTFSYCQAIFIIWIRLELEFFFWQLLVFQSYSPSLTLVEHSFIWKAFVFGQVIQYTNVHFQYFFVLVVVTTLVKHSALLMCYGYFKSKISIKNDAIEYDFCWSKSLTYFESAIYLLGFSTHRINKNSNLNLKLSLFNFVTIWYWRKHCLHESHGFDFENS